MTEIVQEIAVLLVVAAAAGYLLARACRFSLQRPRKARTQEPIVPRDRLLQKRTRAGTRPPQPNSDDFFVSNAKIHRHDT